MLALYVLKIATLDVLHLADKLRTLIVNINTNGA